jgi:hypothetical protein
MLQPAARDDVLDAIDDIEGGSGVHTIIPVSQVPIPAERTWVLKHTDGGLQGELPFAAMVKASRSPSIGATISAPMLA